MHARETLAHSLVIVPTMYLLAAVVLGIVIPAIDRSGTGGGLLGVTPDEAQSILESIAAGMIAFSGLVVSVAVLVVQFGAGQYSPRLVPSFRSDAVIKNALGLLVAPGVYALVAVANVGGSTQDQVGTATLLVALALMVAALVALFRFIGGCWISCDRAGSTPAFCADSCSPSRTSIQSRASRASSCVHCLPRP